MPRIELHLDGDGAVLREFMACRARRSFIRGPYGSGKTFGVAQRILKQMQEQEPNALGVRPTRWMAIRNTFPDLMDTTARDFESVFDGLGKMKKGGLEPPTFSVHFRMPDGTKVKADMVFQALDRPEHVKKLKGRQMTGIWLNESTELVKEVVDTSDLRTGRYPTLTDGGVACTWHGLISDTNSCDHDHWYYKMAEEERPRGWRFFSQPGGVIQKLDDIGEPVDREWEFNPKAENVSNLPGKELYYTDGCSGKKDDWVNVYLANHYGFSYDGMPCHPEYIDGTHTSRFELQANPKWPLILGIDFGRTPAAAICQYDPVNARHLVLDEFCTEDMSAVTFGPMLLRKLDHEYPGLKVHVAWCDPSGDDAGQATDDTPIQILRACGIPARPAPSNAPLLRRAAVANPAGRLALDGKPALIVSPKAKTLRKGLQGAFCYRRMKVSGEERYTELPDKNWVSHVCEGLEYALLGQGEGREAVRIKRQGTRSRQEFARM